ncbi:MAG: hypothetical protein RMA76_30375 [Deltaproteobacteria bacterium]|jgi:hypothetical protein
MFTLGLMLSLAATAPPDVTGLWVRAQRTTTVVDVPVLGDTEVETVAIAIVDVRRVGDEYRMTEKVCAIESESVHGVVRTVYPRAFVVALSGHDKPLRIERAESGLRWIEPRYERVVGEGDQDSDGHPGVTVRIEGLVDGEVYVKQVGWQASEGRFVGDDRVAGAVTFGLEQEILGATSERLQDPLPSRPHPEAKKNPFRARRIPTSATCAQVLARRGALLGL